MRTFRDPTFPAFLLYSGVLLGGPQAEPSCCYCVEPFKLCGVQTAIVRIRMPPSTAMRAEHLCRWDAPHAEPPIARMQNSATHVAPHLARKRSLG